MVFKIIVLALLGAAQGFYPHESNIYTNLKNHHEEPRKILVEDKLNSSYTTEIFFSRIGTTYVNNESLQPLLLVPTGSDKENVDNPSIHHKRRRDVPITSYSYKALGDEDGAASKPSAGSVNQGRPGEEKFYHNDGSFTRNFQTDNGISSTLSGYQKRLPSGKQGTVMQGRYSYTAPDGSTVEVRWTADERGFQAEGPNIPIIKL